VVLEISSRVQDAMITFYILEGGTLACCPVGSRVRKLAVNRSVTAVTDLTAVAR
jgi:hypothetical protein